jgi:membrane protein required for colicin V production
VTQFDFLVIALLVVSAAVGFARGASREMVTVLAFVLAAMSALFGLRYSGPPMRAAIHPGWAADVVAVAVVFLVVYILLRLIGAALVRRIHATEVIGTLDRTVGLGFGLIRALIILGAFNLLFNAATPPERVPHWISGAKLYPLTTAAGRILTAFAPKGMHLAGRLKPTFDHALSEGVGDRTRHESYDARERSEINDLVEKSR